MSLDQAIAEAVSVALKEQIGQLLQLRDLDAKTGGQLLFPEAQAAKICGISRVMLSELRAAGKVTPHRRSRPIMYSREGLAEIVKALGD